MSGLSSQPWLHQHSTEVQRFGTVRQFPLGLTYEARMDSAQRLNHLLADTQIPAMLSRLLEAHEPFSSTPTRTPPVPLSPATTAPMT